MIEAELQAAVIELARVLGWRVAHFRVAKTEQGWRTPVQGDGRGFPDLVLARGPRLVVAELKSASGVVALEQLAWLASFEAAGVDTFVWRPAHWLAGVIEFELRERASVLEREAAIADVDRAARLPCR